MRIEGILEIQAMPAEGEDSPGMTSILLVGGDTIVLDMTAHNYINIFVRKNGEICADVDVMDRR